MKKIVFLTTIILTTILLNTKATTTQPYCFSDWNCDENDNRMWKIYGCNTDECPSSKDWGKYDTCTRCIKKPTPIQ